MIEAFDYELREQVARDAWSAWYRAHGRGKTPYRDQSRSFVVRVFDKPQDDFHQNLLDELQISVELQHENVWGPVQWEGRACRVSGTEGWRLLDVVHTGPAPMAAAVQIARELCAANLYFDSHRLEPIWVPDPERIVIGTDGVTRVEEPGSARLPKSQHVVVQLAPALEPIFVMSPARVMGKPITTASIVREIGAVVHALLSGGFAMKRKSMFDTIKAIIAQPMPTLDVDPQLASVLASACELKPENRPSLQQFAIALDRIGTQLGPPTNPVYTLVEQAPKLVAFA